MVANKKIIPFFLDFNFTLVDYGNEVGMGQVGDKEDDLWLMKKRLTTALKKFEQETGYTPEVYIVTNASRTKVDKNGYVGVCYDIMKTFFDHEGQTKDEAESEIKNSCESYIKGVVYHENDGYYSINPKGKSMEEMFVFQKFSDEAMQIHYDKPVDPRPMKGQKSLEGPEIKRESVARLITDKKYLTKEGFIVCGGDSVEWDFPMANNTLPEKELNRVYINTNGLDSKKASVRYLFCKARGKFIHLVNPKNEKPLGVDDQGLNGFGSREDHKKIENFAGGCKVYFEHKGSIGLQAGIGHAIEYVNELTSTCEYGLE